MITLLIILHVIVCLFLVVIVLLQQGKGADIGATFGGGSSQTLFGTEGPLPILNKVTTAAAVIFMITSVSLAYYSSHNSTGSVMDTLRKQPVKVEKTVPKAVEKSDTMTPAHAVKKGSQAVTPAATEQKTVPEKTKAQ